MAAGLVAAAAAGETLLEQPVGTEAAVDWAAKVAGTLEMEEERMAMATTVAAAAGAS
jgi:nucleoid-associated protein YgaU